MNIDKIRKYIKENRGNTFAFKFKGARNQIDDIYITIIRLHLNKLF